MLIGSLCTGYGGVELGITSAEPAARTVWHAEVDPDASAVLAHHWPDVPNLGDARNAVNAVPVDLIAAGFPCQPISAAGRQLGEADPRWLWPVVREVIEHQRPAAVFLENVANIVSIMKGDIHALILQDLRDLGYACRWTIVGACAVGAAHHRHRWFLYGRHVGDGAPPAEQVEVQVCGSPRGVALPTPQARDGGRRGNEGDAAYRATRAEHRSNGRPLGAVLALLPTPTASEGTGAGHAAQGGINLRTAVQSERFGPYAPAVVRQTDALGMAPPEPTEPNTKGAPRLSAAFAEWLMGLPSGHVTAHTRRAAALRMIGNGAMPQQVAFAWQLLTQPTHEEGPRSMSDTTEAPERAQSADPSEDPSAPLAEPEAPYGVETALGGATRETLRASSHVYADIRQSLDFHSAPGDNNSPAQLLRDVFGSIERAATEASRRRPKNRPPEFAELNPPALRQLAALCRVYAGLDTIGQIENVIAQGVEALKVELGDPPIDITHNLKDPAAEIARIEEEVRAGRMSHQTARVNAGLTADPPHIAETVDPDPFVSPAPVDTWPANIITPLPNGATLITGPPDPFSTPAPIPAGFAPDGSNDGIPF